MLDYVPVNIGQAVVTPLEAVTELFVVKAKQVQPGCLQGMDMHLGACHRETELVGLAV